MALTGLARKVLHRAGLLPARDSGLPRLREAGVSRAPELSLRIESSYSRRILIDSSVKYFCRLMEIE